MRPSDVTLVRIRDPLFIHWYVTVIRVVGTYASPGRPDTRAADSRVLVARRDKMREIRIRPSVGAAPDYAYAWYPLSAVEGDLNVRPRELGLFLRGYLEGWIPDGGITLTG
ncbi:MULTISPECIES: hypothetical protein [unclassified Streptomyces]|uniref:hypothetical protein n=1 Tax=unclassified Streptomyces TaxID=2593676 RepID=UPI001912D713|nr:hypothetical protein [Streptomyces sp. MBT55]MBK6041233.1 hypothetical protein [Streptomyces sp. MBT55]